MSQQLMGANIYMIQQLMGANIYMIKQRNGHCLFDRSNLAESFTGLVSCHLWPMRWRGLISQILVHVTFGLWVGDALIGLLGASNGFPFS